MNIQQLINNRDLLDTYTLSELRQLVEEYPFFQAARLLYLSNLFALHDKSFGEELRKSSVLVPDRTALFQAIEGVHYDIEKNQALAPDTAIITEGEDRTSSLIDTFLSKQDSDDSKGDTQPRSVPTLADVTSDYAAFLQMQDASADGDLATEANQLKGADLIDNFIRETHGKQRYTMPESSLEPNAQGEDLPISDERRAIEDGADDVDLYNEQIVNILIKQEQYQPAYEILQQICLNNPEKNTTFAPQMQLLKVILEK